MPQLCCVPGCKSNYPSTKEYTSVFKFPKDPARRSKWVAQIPRKEFTPSDKSVVCIKHFTEQFICREDSALRPDGTLLVVARERPKLTDDAYPSIFPSCPSYLSTKVLPRRRDPEKRRKEIDERNRQKLKIWLENDRITSYDAFSEELQKRKDHFQDWLLTSKENYQLFFQVDASDIVPVVTASVKVDSNLEIFASVNGCLIKPKTLKWICPKGKKLDSWSKLNSLLSYVNGCITGVDCGIPDEIYAAVHILT